jgi:hypothetical protein
MEYMAGGDEAHVQKESAIPRRNSAVLCSWIDFGRGVSSPAWYYLQVGSFCCK